jgi:hypothetical protein
MAQREQHRTAQLEQRVSDALAPRAKLRLAQLDELITECAAASMSVGTEILRVTRRAKELLAGGGASAESLDRARELTVRATELSRRQERFNELMRSLRVRRDRL